MSSYNQEFMEKALALAKEAGDMGEVPVGAVIVRNGQIIATGTPEEVAKIKESYTGQFLNKVLKK